MEHRQVLVPSLLLFDCYAIFVSSVSFRKFETVSKQDVLTNTASISLLRDAQK